MADVAKSLKELLHEIAKTHKFTNYDVKINPISSGGANYTSQLYSATISNGSEELKLFAKVIAFGEKMRLEGWEKFFEIELLVYTKLSNIYRQLEEKHIVPEEYRLEFSKFYGHSLVRGKEVLVLEDLSAQGYNAYNRLKPVNWLYALQAVKELAKLHALSFAFQHEQPEEFEKVVQKFKFPYVESDNIETLMMSFVEKAYSVLNKEKQRRLEVYIAKLSIKDFFEFMKPVRHPVLVHGDFKMTNLMHKINDEEVYHFKILDYQTMKNGTPVNDLLCFIMTGTDEEFRAKHYFPLLDHYYSQLSLAMRRLGLKPGDIYSRDDFKSELEENLSYGLKMALFFLPMITLEQEDVPIMDETKDLTIFNIDKTGKLYPERMNGIINDYIKWGIL